MSFTPPNKSSLNSTPLSKNTNNNLKSKSVSYNSSSSYTDSSYSDSDESFQVIEIKRNVNNIKGDVEESFSSQADKQIKLELLPSPQQNLIREPKINTSIKAQHGTTNEEVHFQGNEIKNNKNLFNQNLIESNSEVDKISFSTNDKSNNNLSYSNNLSHSSPSSAHTPSSSYTSSYTSSSSISLESSESVPQVETKVHEEDLSSTYYTESTFSESNIDKMSNNVDRKVETNLTNQDNVMMKSTSTYTNTDVYSSYEEELSKIESNLGQEENDREIKESQIEYINGAKTSVFASTKDSVNSTITSLLSSSSYEEYENTSLTKSPAESTFSESALSESSAALAKAKMESESESYSQILSKSESSTESTENRKIQNMISVANELTVIHVQQLHEPMTPPLPKRCFVHPLLWESDKSVYTSRLEDTTLIFLEELIQMQERYESYMMGGRASETVELSSFEVVHGKPFTSSKKRTSASAFSRLFTSSKQSKSDQIKLKAREEIGEKERELNVSKHREESVIERFKHDGRIICIEPTPKLHISKRSMNIALSVLRLTRSEKDKLIKEAEPPLKVETFAALFNACVNTRMKEHVAHIFLMHDAQRKGELPFRQTAELLQRCGVAASPWIADVQIDISAETHMPLNSRNYCNNNNNNNNKYLINYSNRNNYTPELVLVLTRRFAKTESENISIVPIPTYYNKSRASVGNEMKLLKSEAIQQTRSNISNNNKIENSNDNNSKSGNIDNIKDEQTTSKNEEKKNKSSNKEHCTTGSVSENEAMKYERREIRVCGVVDANVLAGRRTSVYWRDNSIFVNDTEICSDIKHESDFERIKTYVEAATYICILVKLFTYVDMYDNLKTTVQYPHVVRTLLLAEMTSESLEHKLHRIRKHHHKLLTADKNMLNTIDLLVHEPRNLFIQNVFRNHYYVNREIILCNKNNNDSNKSNLNTVKSYRSFRLLSFLHDRFVESSLQETNNTQLKRARNALPSNRANNEEFLESSSNCYIPLSMVCNNMKVLSVGTENIFFRFSLNNVRVPQFTPENYECYCLVSAMTIQGVFLPAIKFSVKRVAPSKTFPDSETWIFDGVEHETDWNVLYYRGHLTDKLFVECCYERNKENRSEEREITSSCKEKLIDRSQSVANNNATINSTQYFVTDDYSTSYTWHSNNEHANDSVATRKAETSETVWCIGYAVLSLSSLEFNKKGICHKRLKVIVDSLSNYDISEAKEETDDKSSTGNTSKEDVTNVQHTKSNLNLSLANAVSNENNVEAGRKSKKEKSSGVVSKTRQACHVDLVIYSKKLASKSTTQAVNKNEKLRMEKEEIDHERHSIFTEDLPERSLIMNRHLLLISDVRKAIRYIGKSSHHTHQTLHQFKVSELINVVSNVKLLDELLKLWKYQSRHMTPQQKENKKYNCEELLMCAASIYSVSKIANIVVEKIAKLIIEKKRIQLSQISVLPSPLSTITCERHPIII